MTDLDAYFAAEMEEHAEVQQATAAALREPFRRLVGACVQSLRAGGKILLFGNGGSAADAQHIAAELIVRYKKDRAPIPAIALTTDTSALTAIGNDYEFGRLFERQVEALGRAGDVALGISTSGKSENVIRALHMAKKIGAVAAALSGGDGGRLKGLADPLLIVPSRTIARIQEMHITLGQMLCGAIELELGLVS